MRGFDAAVADETPASPSLTVANCLPQFALTVEIHRYSQRHFLISCDTCRRVHDMQNMPCFPNQKPRARAACCRPWPWRASATPLPPWRRRSSRWRPRAPPASARGNTIQYAAPTAIRTATTVWRSATAWTSTVTASAHAPVRESVCARAEGESLGNSTTYDPCLYHTSD